MDLVSLPFFIFAKADNQTPPHPVPQRTAVSIPRYFSVRYSFRSNSCSIERFLNLGMLYPNGELSAFTKSFT